MLSWLVSLKCNLVTKHMTGHFHYMIYTIYTNWVINGGKVKYQCNDIDTYNDTGHDKSCRRQGPWPAVSTYHTQLTNPTIPSMNHTYINGTLTCLQYSSQNTRLSVYTDTTLLHYMNHVYLYCFLQFTFLDKNHFNCFICFLFQNCHLPPKHQLVALHTIQQIKTKWQGVKNSHNVIVGK